MVKVLVVEDDAAIGRALLHALIALDHDASWECTGAAALRSVTNEPPDVVLLDLGLPDVDGSTLLVMIRSFSAVPVIVVTARVEQDEAIRLLDLGADDYITKPFAVDQLDARIRAVLRRWVDRSRDAASSANLLIDSPIRIGGLQIDPRAQLAELDGKRLDLRLLEFRLLATLAAAGGNPLSSATLCRALWDRQDADLAGRLDVHLSSLRSKLGETARAPRYLHRVRGVGIRLLAPLES